MLTSGRPARSDVFVPGHRENKKTAAPARGMSNEPCALRRFPALCHRRRRISLLRSPPPKPSPICDPNCSTFSFFPVSPPPVVCARRSCTCRWRRSSWSRRPPPPHRVVRELIDDEDPSPLLASLPPRGAHPRAGCCFLRSSSAHRSQCRLPLPAAGARRRSCGTLYTELSGGQGGAPHGRARELTGGAGRRSRS
jgi:hypothetical protein